MVAQETAAQRAQAWHFGLVSDGAREWARRARELAAYREACALAPYVVSVRVYEHEMAFASMHLTVLWAREMRRVCVREDNTLMPMHLNNMYNMTTEHTFKP